MQLCLVWTGEREELQIASLVLLMEYRLAGFLAYSEVFQGRDRSVVIAGAR
jgi:hypothetical protein